MDKQKDPIDELFRDKLEQHQEKPSGLAWERLESQLGPGKPSNKWGWISVAAMFIGVMGLAYLLWQYAPAEQATAPQIAEKTVERQQVPNESINAPSQPTITDQPALAEAPAPVTAEVKTKSKQTSKQPTDQTQPKRTSNAPVKPVQKESLPIADHNVKNTPMPKADVTTLPQREVPEPNIAELITENTTTTPTEEESVSYKVRIKSSGLSEKPKKEKLVEEIGDKINTLGGLLGKVDQGYADLQDAKNNLFAALITKNETK
ncbi:hypothetical protein FKX85_01775 [Echinicola soli]|uniref:Uncharacterized protein n=1 Tax=Echinicola soli TaxID=2591634 RepID=A0A514CDJ4_9BACT|nr:hypothetical protein [Echinicola soli]QDH77840.1 hypothetical protein FKX85_01775 [Echinicola soli]